MRKFILIALTAAMAFVTACGNSDNGNGTGSASITESVRESGISSYHSESKSEYLSDTSSEMPEISSTVTESTRFEQSADKEDNALNIEITVNGRTFSAALYDNETAKAFKKQLPLTLDMSELNGNEKYYYLSDSLPANSSRPSGIHTGDIMLYGNSCLVIFYESFSTSYSYTPIGRIDDSSGLAAALGNDSVQVTFRTCSH